MLIARKFASFNLKNLKHPFLKPSSFVLRIGIQDWPCNCELGLRQVIIKGDSQTIIHALARETPTPISIQQIIAGSKTWLTTFTSWATSFTRRDSMPRILQIVRYGWRTLPLLLYHKFFLM